MRSTPSWPWAPVPRQRRPAAASVSTGWPNGRRGLRAAVDDDSRLERLGWAPSFAVGNVGRAGNWPNIDRVRDRVKALEPCVTRLRDRVQQAWSRAHRRRAGPFHRRRGRGAAAGGRAGVPRPAGAGPGRPARPGARGGGAGGGGRRYQRLLLDEFQDTDPIQVELAVLIASTDPDGRDQAVVGGGGRAGTAVLRRRPEAVDLPLPPGGHRHVPAGPRPVRRRSRTADRQLPHDQADPGVGQPHVRAAHL